MLRGRLVPGLGLWLGSMLSCSVPPSGGCGDLVGCSAALNGSRLPSDVSLGSRLLCSTLIQHGCVRAFVEAEESGEGLPVDCCFHSNVLSMESIPYMPLSFI